MKQILSAIIALFAIFTLSSCEKEETEVSNLQSFNISIENDVLVITPVIGEGDNCTYTFAFSIDDKEIGRIRQSPYRFEYQLLPEQTCVGTHTLIISIYGKHSENQANTYIEKKISVKLQSFIDELKVCNDANSALAVIKKWNKYNDKIDTQFTTIYVHYSLDTRNKTYKKANDKLDEVSPVLANKNQFIKLLAGAKYRKDLENKLGKFYFQMIDTALKAFDEKIIPEMIEDNKLGSKYNEIMGGAQIEFRGEILNLSQLGKYTQDNDRNTRREAAKALDKWLGEHNEELGELYSKMVLNRDKMAKKLGYKNYVELGYLVMSRYDYDAKMVANYRKQIGESVVPLCNKLYKAQMKNLGIKNPQYYDYNLSFKSGNPVPAGDTKYLVDQAHVMYSGLGQESKEFFEMMINNELMDLTARKGKTTGSYCTYFPKYKAPFIFSNFNGTSGDVNVLTHEGGHALQAYLSSSYITSSCFFMS